MYSKVADINALSWLEIFVCTFWLHWQASFWQKWNVEFHSFHTKGNNLPCQLTNQEKMESNWP